MRIAILDLCLPDPMSDEFGSSGEITRRWLQPALPEAALTIIDIAGGAALPEAEGFDGFVLTGSEKGVYDETEWMEPLKALLRAVRAARRPVFGICFGHQIMAETYGGKAEKAGGGFAVGARTYQAEGRPFDAHVIHQDQVTQVPPGARVTASAPYCPAAALDYDFPARSVQFHPEYDARYLSHAIEMFDGGLITPVEAAAARATMAGAEVAKDLCAADAAALFRSAMAGAG